VIASKQAVFFALQSTIKGLERHSLESVRREYVSSGFPVLDERLPHGGLPLGALIEILSDAGSGALTLALLLAGHAITRSAGWAVVETAGTRAEGLGARTATRVNRASFLTPNPSALVPFFYPPAAAQLGLDMGKLILVRPPARQSGWCFTQLLRCAEIGASFLSTRSGENMLFRRFQLAVERGGGQGFILRPPDALRKPCWAALRLEVKMQNSKCKTDDDIVLEIGEQRSMAVKILHVRR
jgi:protein ImuA